MADRPADALVRVATVFNAAEFAVTRSFLAAPGIIGAAEPIHLINNFPHLATAMGGVPILVLAPQAGEAEDLLVELRWREQSGRRSLLRWLGYVLFFGLVCGLGVAPPSSGRVIHCRRPTLAQGAQPV